MSALDVLANESFWSAEQGDCLPWLSQLPPASVDLVLFSPPYEKARLYLEDGKDLAIARGTEPWVAWMVKVFQACLRVCKGLVACVCEGQTKDYRWSAGPALLMADLHRAGVHLRKPPAYHRFGIPGSGGPDWWRNDYEFVICATNGGKLPWSDNTATGHVPKWAPGGEMSHRLTDGARVNQFGMNGKVGSRPDGKPIKEVGSFRPSHRFATAEERKAAGKPFKVKRSKLSPGKGGSETTEGEYEWTFVPPVLANPGNVIRCNVGGGQMGSDLAHENEAPFPEALVEPFVRCFCPEGGVVCDPFCGSGTTGAVALRWGRRFIGCDLRKSQVLLTRRRLQPEVNLFNGPVKEDPT